MEPEIVTFLSFLYIVIWIFIGYRVTKSEKATPNRFALFFSLGLAFLKMFLSFFLLSSPDNIVVGMTLFIIALIVGYPVAYLLFQRRIQKYK